jgi:hypothetical protein
MAKKRKLDRGKSFGTIFGAGAACFEQHGIQFDSAGDELPGFEKVEVPADAPVPAGTDEGLKAQLAEQARINARLQAELGKLQDDLDRAQRDREDAQAANEERQGKLDTATIEIERLNELLAGNGEDKAAVPDPKANAKNKKKGELDAQLALQTGGVD